MDGNVFQHLGIAIGLGLLVGLQREWVTSPIAGIRTFPMIAVLGVLSTLLAQELGGWVLASAVIGLAAFVVAGNIAKLQRGETDPGMTTAVATLVMFLVGAVIALGQTGLGVTAGGTVAVLLHWKRPLHEFVARVGESDLRAVIRLVLIALVILPVLPNQTYGPYQVLNPFRIWLMVVLIVGISLAAYVAYRIVGAKAGAVLGGTLGGLISSTATTVSFGRESRRNPQLSGMAAVVIMIASTVVFVRVIFEVWVVAPEFIGQIGPPLIGLAVLIALVAGGMYLVSRGQESEAMPPDTAPSDLRAAVVFGLLYAVILLAVAAATEHFGQAGLYVVAALSGLADMDALTLSTAELVRADRMTTETGWRLIVVAGMGNMVFKGAAVALIGDRRLFRKVAIGFALTLAASGLVLAFWP